MSPVQGQRLQPTGFPDLGAAIFNTPGGTQALLVESSQSMANRMEEVCWSIPDNNWIPELRGLPYIEVYEDGKFITNSVLESHRMNSPYILESKDKTFFNQVRDELADMERGAVDLQKLARFLLKYDPGCLLHGVFLAKKELAGGRLRIARSLSSFIEAENVNLVASGGVKFDRVDPKGDTKHGYGNVPFHRDEYTAETITAYFNVDISQIRAYGLGDAVTELLTAWSLLKIRLVLERGLRLRTACDLAASEPEITNIPDASLPATEYLLNEMPSLIRAAHNFFADPPVTKVHYVAGKK